MGLSNFASTPQAPFQVGLASTSKSNGQVIGILEFGGGFTTTEVASFFKAAGISPAPKVVAVSVDGTPGN